MDYLKDLTLDELVYMNRFMGEWVSGAFRKNVDKTEYLPDNLHKTALERQECYGRNNARNRCQLTVANATGRSVRSDDITSIVDAEAFNSLIEDDKIEKFVIGIEDAGGYEAISEGIEDERYEDYLIYKRDNTKLKYLGEAYVKILLELYDPDFKKKG